MTTDTNNRIHGKWKFTGLLSGLSTVENKSTKMSKSMECALFLEQTAREMIKIGSKSIETLIVEDNNNDVMNYAFPVARRIFDKSFHHKSFVPSLVKWFKENAKDKKDEQIVKDFIEFYTKKGR